MSVFCDLIARMITGSCASECGFRARGEGQVVWLGHEVGLAEHSLHGREDGGLGMVWAGGKRSREVKVQHSSSDLHTHTMTHLVCCVPVTLS